MILGLPGLKVDNRITKAAIQSGHGQWLEKCKDSILSKAQMTSSLLQLSTCSLTCSLHSFSFSYWPALFPLIKQAMVWVLSETRQIMQHYD